MREYTREELQPVFEIEEDVELYVDLLDLEKIQFEEISISQMQESNDQQESFQKILESFTTCVSKEAADQLIFDFLKFNNKMTRKSLISVKLIPLTLSSS